MQSDQQHVILLRFLTATCGSHFAHQSHCHGVAGFPPIREIRENFEDIFQSGKSGKNGFFSQNQGKKIQIRELFPNHFQTFEENVF